MRGKLKRMPGLARLYGWARGLKHARDNARVLRAYMAAHDVCKLHVGCGYHLLPGWLNGDLWRCDPSVLWLDALAPYPVPPGALDYVFSEHVIEHMPLQDGLRMLAHAHAALRPGGRLRISTPDLGFLVALHAGPHSVLQQRYMAWTATHILQQPDVTTAMVVNNFVRDWGHCFIYDPPTLRWALERTGFVDVESHRLGKSDDPHLRGLENEARMPEGLLQLESFTLEARKP
jgi:predicted SAM-dependent methyltransferase